MLCCCDCLDVLTKSKCLLFLATFTLGREKLSSTDLENKNKNTSMFLLHRSYHECFSLIRTLKQLQKDTKDDFQTALESHKNYGVSVFKGRGVF